MVTPVVAESAVLPALSIPPARCEAPAETHGELLEFDNNIAAFRGLGFAIVIETLAAIIGIGAWEVLRRLF